MGSTNPNNYQDGDILRVTYEGTFATNSGLPLIRVYSDDRNSFYPIGFERAVEVEVVRRVIELGQLYQDQEGNLYRGGFHHGQSYVTSLSPRRFDVLNYGPEFDREFPAGLRKVKIVLAD